MNATAFLFFVAAIFALGAAIRLARQVSVFLASAKKARGVVVRQDSSSPEEAPSEKDDEKTALYAPVIRFQDEMGNFHEFTSQVGSNPPRWPNGSAVDVLYDPKKPETASITLPLVLWTKPMILGAIGGVMLLGAILNIS